MRIRKTLAKALGQLKPSTPPSDPWPVPFPTSHNSIDGLSGISCPLNQSPWDVYPNHRFVRSSFKCGPEYIQSLPKPTEDLHEDTSCEIPESDDDAFGKKPTMETIEKKSHLGKREIAQSKNKRKGSVVEMENNKIIMCKKNDGRNWFCKQPAKLPHNFCEHHLRLSRSYKDPSGSGVGGTTKIQKETKTLNSDYYYYGTVAPSGGKRRRGRNADDGCDVVHVEEEKIDIINVSDGDDGDDEDEDGDGDGDGDDENYEDEDDDEVQVLDHTRSHSNSEENLRSGAKKGRKLVKYRSLDSFSAAESESSVASDSNY